jgi:hypothetical protein
MAATRKPKAKPKVEVEVDELEEDEELDELDELEALADEVDEDEESEDAEDEDDEDEDEDESPRARKKKTVAKAKPKRRESDTYGTSALADDLGTDGKNLRVMLRDLKANRPRKKGTTGSFNEAGRYEWADLDDALDTLGFDSVEDAVDRLTEARNTRLDALKERNAKKTKTKAKAKPVEEDEEEEEFDDEEEDEEPAPKKRTTRSTRTRSTRTRK